MDTIIGTQNSSHLNQIVYIQFFSLSLPHSPCGSSWCTETQPGIPWPNRDSDTGKYAQTKTWNKSSEIRLSLSLYLGERKKFIKIKMLIYFWHFSCWITSNAISRSDFDVGSAVSRRKEKTVCAAICKCALCLWPESTLTLWNPIHDVCMLWASLARIPFHSFAQQHLERAIRSYLY